MTTERELVVSLAEDTAEMLERQYGTAVIAQANTVARRYGIDGGYIQHVLNRDSEHWPKLPGRQREALLALVDVSDASLKFDYGNGFSLPEFDEEFKTDAVIRELGKWAWDHRKQILQDYFKVIRPHLPEARAYLEEVTGKVWSERDTMIWLHATLKEHLKTSPAGIWRGLMLYRVLDLVF